jgi:hypothetical protein
LGDGKVEGSRERREREGGEEMRGNKVQGRVEDCGDGDGSARARESLRTVLYLGRHGKARHRRARLVPSRNSCRVWWRLR